MAEVFISGKPGHGKTLYAIWHIKRYIEADHKSKLKEDPEAKPREVWYYGISDLTLDWHKMDDPLNWWKCPVGSVIVIDEAQRHFPALSNAAKRPKAYTEIDTHRHKGFDVFMITQDPVNVDKRFTTMADRHYHIVRAFNTDKATIYEFQAVEYVSGTKYKRIPDAIKKQWSYPKEVYNYYKSAEVHTYKNRLPIIRILMYVSPLLIIAILIPHLYGRMQDRGGAIDNTEPKPSPGGGSPITNVIDMVAPGLRTTSNQFVPLRKDEPLSTPFYQEVITIKSYPRLSGCSHMKMGKHETCKCNDQRGNYINISFVGCLAYLQNGYFDYSIDDTLETPQQQTSDNSRSTNPIPDNSPFDILTDSN